MQLDVDEAGAEHEHRAIVAGDSADVVYGRLGSVLRSRVREGDSENDGEKDQQ